MSTRSNTRADTPPTRVIPGEVERSATQTRDPGAAFSARFHRPG